MTGPIRILELVGSPETIGAHHGSSFRSEIQGYAKGRVALAAAGTPFGYSDILALVDETIPAHRDYSPSLFAETEALAAAAGLTIPEAIVVSGYTDVLDLVRARAGVPVAIEDNCTAVMVPSRLSVDGALFAQTWDMNASATPHVIMLELAPTDRPKALVFSTVGCVGQIGMNEYGVCVGINNLSASDGRPGVTWPFVVRQALEQTSAKEALGAVLNAPLAGGHNFHILDRDGIGFSVEAMPTSSHVTELGDGYVVRTNHCLSGSGKAREAERPLPLQENSERRLVHALEYLNTAQASVESLIELTKDERSICRHPEPPYDYETCGAMVMKPDSGELWAAWGRPSETEYEAFRLPVTEAA